MAEPLKPSQGNKWGNKRSICYREPRHRQALGTAIENGNVRMILLSALILLQAITPAQVQHAQRSAPAVRASLEAQMFDYPSARFRDVHITRNPVAEAERGAPGLGYFCGFVNGKNRMGAYTGWQRFITINGEVTLAGDSINDMIIDSACVRNGVTDGVDRSAWVTFR